MMRVAGAWGLTGVTALLVCGCSGVTLWHRGPAPAEVARGHYHKALRYVDAQDIDMALDEIERAIDADPAAAKYRQLHARLLGQQGQYVQAELEYRQAVSRDPYDDASWEGLIQVVRAQGDKERVPPVIRERVRVDPLDVDWRLRLGLAYEEIGELLGAERELKAAADLAKGERAAYAHARLGIVYEALGQRAAAIREYEESLTINPDQVEVRRILERLKAAPK